jgi:hypothetical protein
LPTAHAMQSDSASFPLVSRYVTGGQSRYVLLDDEQLMPEYLSESHLPVAHATQSDSASLPSGPKIFTWATNQSSTGFRRSLRLGVLACFAVDTVGRSCFDLHLPLTHVVQFLPSGPEKSVLQEQAVKTVLPAGELEFSGHIKHTEIITE